MARTKTTKYYSARKGNRGDIFITIFLLFVAQVSLLFQSFYSTRKRGRGMEAAVGAKTERRRKELLERRTVAPIVQKKRDPTTTKIPFHTQRPSTPKRKDETSKKKLLTGLTKRKGISYSFLKLHAWHKTCIKACFCSSSIPRFFSYPFENATRDPSFTFFLFS